MKKLYGLLIVCLTALTFTACDEDNDVVILEAPGNITVEAGYGEAIFTWSFPDDQNVEFVRVDYLDDDGIPQHQKFSEYNDAATISGLSERAYEFKVAASDKHGNLSEPTTLNVTPNKPPYMFVANTLAANPDFGSVIVTWENLTEKEVGVNIKYVDVDGLPQIFVANSSEVDGEAVLSGLSNEEQTFEVYVTSQNGIKSPSQFFELAPYSETKFDKSNWEIVDFSSQEAGGEGPVNGYATAAIDGDVNTFWHSAWSTGSPSYPHWITADMKEVKVVSRVVLFTRNNDSRGMTKFTIEGSLDNTTWEMIGEFDFDNTDFSGQSYRLSSNPEMRYIRMTAIEGPNNFTFLAELDVYGE
ncbi:F5/8 type C domain-containing protein [Zhouia amylolytica]|uniref:F5/8 type C domain-containing protein n=1 Tax=Zhouia amylolytica TaxID=376730 RepID=A0A1I6NYJ1_9FLAO|nr:discoidin domain-containing protein [Zhouia amylolytica]MCQ0112891.1 discoidin domain-containing protein [Zhouia amylolytica]SFS32991.1 F5/8 type C domain-containing protein [Zhouia amylolytica]